MYSTTLCLTCKVLSWVVKNLPGALFIVANDKPEYLGAAANYFLISVPNCVHVLAFSLDHPSKCRQPRTHVCLKRFVTGQTAFSLGTVITSRTTPTLRDSERGSDSAHTCRSW